MSTPTEAHHRWLETLFERHGQALRAFATRRVGPDAAASDLVERVLAQLADMDAEVVRLTVWEELAPGEIATVPGISPGAARTRLMRARRRAQEVYLASEPETQPTPSIA